MHKKLDRNVSGDEEETRKPLGIVGLECAQENKHGGKETDDQ
jgi:hypothetical protein